MSSLLNRLAPAFDELVIKKGFKDKTVVDIGCGFGRWGHLIRSQVDEGGNDAYLIGCDIFPHYLKEVKKHNPYNELVICDARWLPFQRKSVDTAIAFEMIEHLPKKDALKFLSLLSETCRDNIIISTPFGFMTQPAIRGNNYEIHKSAWVEGDFREMGFNVYFYGLGMGIESLCKRFRLDGPVSNLLRIMLVKKWTGIQLGAEKKQKPE